MRKRILAGGTINLMEIEAILFSEVIINYTLKNQATYTTLSRDMLRSFLYILTAFIFSFSVIAKEIKYPNLSGIGESRLGFSVLKLALDKADKDYQLTVDLRQANPNRALFMLETGQIDVIDGGFSPEVIDTFEPIYLPLDMGLSGWRVFVIHKDTAKRLSSVQTIEDLKSYTFGQGQGWYDIDILERADLTVITAPKLSNLFGMVKVKRFDLLSLGANEAYRYLELFGHKYDQLVVDDRITLIYPFGRFFYVRKNDKELKQAIEVGLEKALSDGSLLSLLKSHPYFRDIFEYANLDARVQIRIETPNLTDGFKSIDPKWWYSP